MQPKYINIYSDKRLNNLVPVNEDKPALNLDTVDGGDSRRYSFFIQNIHEYGVLSNIKILVDSREISIIKCPESIGINESAELILEWNADISIERGIKPNFEMKYNLICN